MDLAHPIRALVPSLEGPVLTVLAGLTDAVSGREVARLAGTASPAGVQRVLSRLVTEGVVRAERRSHAVLYSANRDHLAWPAVEVLTGLRRELLQRITDAVRAWPHAPRTAAVFGSLARGEGGVDSDVDLLLVHEDDLSSAESRAWEAQVDALVAAVEAWTGNAVQPYVVSVAQFQAHVEASEAIVGSWRREAVTLVGSDVSALVRSVTR